MESGISLSVSSLVPAFGWQSHGAEVASGTRYHCTTLPRGASGSQKLVHLERVPRRRAVLDTAVPPWSPPLMRLLVGSVESQQGITGTPVQRGAPSSAPFFTRLDASPCEGSEEPLARPLSACERVSVHRQPQKNLLLRGSRNRLCPILNLGTEGRG